MKKLRNSMMVLVGFTAIVGLIAFVTPMPGRGQEKNAPPARDVNVVNPATSPVLVRDVDSGREPFEKTQAIHIQNDTSIEEVAFAVPEGKRFVMESVSASVVVLGTDTTQVSVATRLAPGASLGIHHIAVSRQAVSFIGEPIYVGTHSIRAYAGSGTSVVVQVSHNNPESNLDARVTITGYFVSVP